VTTWTSTTCPFALLRFNYNIRSDRQCSKVYPKNRQSPVRGSAHSTAISADHIFAFVVEALPFIVPSNFAGGTGDASVDEVSQQYDRQCRSYHGAPSFRLSSYIDSHVTAQMLVFVFTLEVSFAGVDVSFAFVVKVILRFVIGHIITS